MSFILDALRKSDAERQRSTTPGLTSVRYGSERRPRRDFWIRILAVVLALNALFLGIQWLRSGRTPAPPPAAVPALAPATGTLPGVLPAPPPVVDSGDVRPLAQEADLEPESAEPEVPGATQGAVTPPVVAESAEPAPVVAAEPAAVATAPVPPVAGPAPADSTAKPAKRVADDLPSADELISSGRLTVPPLNLDLHVYGAAPASRFVVINSRKYKEGARLQEGPSVETITPDGVILDSQGTRFVLPRK